MEKWEEGFYITAMAGSMSGSSLVVMSKGTPYTQQSYKVGVASSVHVILPAFGCGACSGACVLLPSPWRRCQASWHPAHPWWPYPCMLCRPHLRKTQRRNICCWWRV